MDLHIACPGCDKHFRVAAEHSGEKVKCPSCQILFLVPSNEEAEQASSPGPANGPGSGSSPGAPPFGSPGHGSQGYGSQAGPPGQPSSSGSGHPGAATPAQTGYPSASGGAYQQPGGSNPGYAMATTGYNPHGVEKPSNINTIGVMMLIGGIMGIMAFLGIGFGSSCVCFFWPPLYLQIITGIMCIVKGSQLMGNEGHHSAPPTIFAVMMILNVLNLDFLNMTMGIICLVMLNDPPTKAYFRG